MHLQKIIGFRPPLELMTTRNLIFSQQNFKSTVNNTKVPTSEICWTICNADVDCIAYVHLIDTDDCYGYSYVERSDRFVEIGQELSLVADANAIFYEKTCLNGKPIESSIYCQMI